MGGQTIDFLYKVQTLLVVSTRSPGRLDVYKRKQETNTMKS